MNENLTDHNAQSGNSTPSSLKGWHFALGAFILLALYGFGFQIGGEPSSIMQASLQSVPFAVLALLAYAAIKQPASKIISILWLLGVVGSLAALTVLNSFAAVLVDPTAIRAGQELPEFIPGGQLQLTFVFLGTGLAVVLGVLSFMRPIRVWLSKLLPLDPDNFVHTIALAAAIMLILVPAIPLLFLGQPPLLAVVNGFSAEGEDFINRSDAGLLRDQLYTLIWLLPSVVLAVGYGLRRNFSDSLARLGLAKLTWRQTLFGVGFAIVIVFAVSGLEILMGWLWGVMGWTRTDGEAFGLIVDFALTPLGALVIGVSAGLGEELAVRGVLQPRLGILLSNLVFTSLHALQYNWDGLIIVFVIGLLFGFVRKYSQNTTLCALIHGLYDFILIMAVVIELPGFEF